MGDCDRQEVSFFENNLHYRQCKRCKMVVEKNQGCNHITCRCGYQFCYVCGAEWAPAHYGNHDENGQLLAVPNPGAQAVIYVRQEEGCCQCLDDCDDGCGPLVCILKAPIQLLLFIGLLIFMALIFLNRDIFVIGVMLVLTLLVGITGFTLEIISETEGLMCLLAVLFLPVTMVLGVIRAFQEFFCETVGDLCGNFC
jgi:hypothetical protein